MNLLGFRLVIIFIVRFAIEFVRNEPIVLVSFSCFLLEYANVLSQHSLCLLIYRAYFSNSRFAPSSSKSDLNGVGRFVKLDNSEVQQRKNYFSKDRDRYFSRQISCQMFEVCLFEGSNNLPNRFVPYGGLVSSYNSTISF